MCKVTDGEHHRLENKKRKNLEEANEQEKEMKD